METIEQPSCKELYEQSNGAKVLLMSMVIGLRSEDDKRNLGDMTLEPYASSTQKSNFSPKKNDLVNEIKRRYATMLSATTDSTSPVSRKSRGAKKSKVEHESSNIPQQLVDGFKSISRASNSEEITNCESRIEKAERSIEAYIKKLEDCEDGMLREFYEERLTAARIRLSNSTAEYEKLYA